MARRLAIRDFEKSGNFVDTSTTIVTNTSAATLFSNGSFSVAFWVKTTQKTAGRTIVGRRAGTTLGSVGWLTGPSGSGFVFVEYSDGTNEPGSSGLGPKPISDGDWHHVVLVTNRETDRAYAYVDGVAGGTQLDISALGDIETGATSNFRVGRDGGGNNAFLGKVDELIIWNTVITEDEAMELYASGSIPQRDSRVLQWNFNDDATDQSGNGVDGTVSGVTYSTDVPTVARTPATSRTTATNRVAVRDMGTALKSTAVNHYVSLGTSINDEINTAQAFTVSQWVRRNTRSSLQSFMGVPAGDKFWFNFDSDNGVRLYQQNLTPAFTKTNAKITDTEWHHLVGTFNGTTRQIYIDGIVQSYTATNTSTGTLNLNNTFYLVAFPTGNNFIGTVDEPRIWNRALTADEIQKLYLYGQVPRNGLVAEYLFDEASGTTAYDTSGNGNNGTITGATYTTDVPLTLRDSI